MKYYKRLQNELANLADKLGQTVTSDFRYDYSKSGTRARALQLMVKLIGFVIAMDAELKDWRSEDAKEWIEYLGRLEKWVLLMPTPSDSEPSLPTYQDMLMRLCTDLELGGNHTFESVMAHLVKEQEKFGKIKMLMLNNDGTLASRQAQIHDILWG